jgi:hypothetical protein
LTNEMHIREDDFFTPPSEKVLKRSIEEFIDKTSNAALALTVCMVCAREEFVQGTTRLAPSMLPNDYHLCPVKSHPAHDLMDGRLLHRPAVDSEGIGAVCADCYQNLLQDKKPPFALSNGLWIGEVPHVLAVLTLPERLLIGRYFPAAYIVKLFPKKKGAAFWDKSTMNSGLRGNVSTYRLNTQELGPLMIGSKMPPSASVLSATIGITFVGPKGCPEATLPDFFRVRRKRVEDALVWLKANNPLYADINICESRLSELPINAVPAELIAITKISDDDQLLSREVDGYVPEDDAVEQQGVTAFAAGECKRMNCREKLTFG